MLRAAIITVSDKGSRGEREDLTGPALRVKLESKGYKIEYYSMIPDEMVAIERELRYLCDDVGVQLVVTNGGTGFSQRDITPEATMKVIDRYVPGIGEVMRMKSREITSRAMLSRAIAGIRKNTLIVNLPGSPKGAVENLQFVIDDLKHGIEIMVGSTGECARK